MQTTAPGQQVVVQAFGETPLDAIAEHLVLREQPPPDPATLASHDVIVAVKSAAVGWVDLLMTSGQYQHMPKPPYCPGLEYSGDVIWTGDDVDPSQLNVGDRVLSDGFLTGPRSSGDYQAHGGFASYAVAPQEALHRIPDHFSYDQGCNLLSNYETAYHCLIHCGELQPGETALIHGATGATGLAAVHLAKLVGATVIATGRSTEKLEAVQAQGADHVLVTGDGEGGVRRFRDDVKALTDGHGADVVYDGVGGDISLETLRCLRFGARFLIVGWASTPFVAKGKGGRGAPNVNTLPTNLILMKGLKVLGCPAVISTQKDPTVRPARLKRLFQWVEEERISPCVAKVFPLSEIKDALHAKWESQFVGGCVVHP